MALHDGGGATAALEKAAARPSAAVRSSSRLWAKVAGVLAPRTRAPRDAALGVGGEVAVGLAKGALGATRTVGDAGTAMLAAPQSAA